MCLPGLDALANRDLRRLAVPIEALEIVSKSYQPCAHRQPVRQMRPVRAATTQNLFQ